MNELLKNCVLCPKKCGVNRYNDKGFCGATNKIKIAYYSLHQWEEPIISGTNGSGTIFFSNCNMKCMYCQNKKISIDGYGVYISNKELKEIMLLLQEKGAHNINLVTPTMYTPQLNKILNSIKGKELTIPVVYNTSSYENIIALKIMNNLVDIYLADLKYFDDSLAKKYSLVDNYFETATLAIDEMYRQVGSIKIENDLLVKGLVVRVLVLPGHIDDSKKIIEYLYKTYGNEIIISIMSQYTPVNKCRYDNLNRKLTKKEYEEVVEYASNLGITNAFIQEGDSSGESFIPDFNKNIINK